MEENNNMHVTRSLMMLDKVNGAMQAGKGMAGARWFCWQLFSEQPHRPSAVVLPAALRYSCNSCSKCEDTDWAIRGCTICARKES